MPTDEELGKCERVIPLMNEMLLGKGLVKVAEEKILVTRLKGPLEDGWQEKVEAFAAQIPVPEPQPLSREASVSIRTAT